MRHVVLDRHSRTVHRLEDGQRETICHQSIMTGETFEGMPVYKAIDSPKPVSCHRCLVGMRESVYHTVKHLSPVELERVVKELDVKILNTRRYAQYHK